MGPAVSCLLYAASPRRCPRSAPCLPGSPDRAGCGAGGAARAPSRGADPRALPAPDPLLLIPGRPVRLARGGSQSLGAGTSCWLVRDGRDRRPRESPTVVPLICPRPRGPCCCIRGGARPECGPTPDLLRSGRDPLKPSPAWWGLAASSWSTPPSVDPLEDSAGPGRPSALELDPRLIRCSCSCLVAFLLELLRPPCRPSARC